MRSMRRAGALTVAVLLGFGLVACGGDDDGGDGAATEDTSGDDTTTTEASSDDGGSDGSDTGAVDFSGECLDFSQAFADAGSQIGQAFTGTATAEDFQQVADYFSEVADDVPDEIKSDFETYADAYQQFAQAIADSDIDFSDPSSINADDLSELQALGEAFSSTDIQEASQNISDYVTENCTNG